MHPPTALGLLSVTGPAIHTATRSRRAVPKTGGLLSALLLPSGVYAVELHAHSAASHDGRDSVEQLLEVASERGLDALAVTDHDEIDASQRAADLASDYGLVGIVGMEISSAAGHVLALGIETAIDPGLSFGETLGQIADQGGIAVVPHPFQEMRSGVIRTISRDELAAADAIEVYNSRLVTGYSNRQAHRFARQRGLPMTAGSDAHVCDMVGRAVTMVDAEERTSEAICAAIAEGRTTLRTQRTPFHISLRQAVGNTRRRLRMFVQDRL
jgi:predicted metal-dependent phosphoesterase TrpH